MKDVRMGYIGTGPRAQSMIGIHQRVSGCRVTAICDRIEPLVQQAYEERVQDKEAVTCYTDHRKMLKEANIDAVFIGVAPEHNADLVCEVLEAGKHVMCEVPLCYTIEDCWRVVLAVEKSGLKFQMAEQMRFAPYIQAWKQMVAEGELGKIIFVEGQYLHGRTRERYWNDSKTGKRLTLEEAKDNPNAIKSRAWRMSHPILYLPHELSPILSILEDRVVKVTCMGTRCKSYKYDWFPTSDIEVALMHTANDTVLRLAAGFTITPVPHGCTHWYHLMGTEGSVETNRYTGESMKLFKPGPFMKEHADMKWEFNPDYTSREAMASGHGGNDYYPMANFVECINNDTPPPMDVYKAADTAAPPILAARSVEEDNQCFDVPDFRPNERRKEGEAPKE